MIHQLFTQIVHPDSGIYADPEAVLAMLTQSRVQIPLPGCNLEWVQWVLNTILPGFQPLIVSYHYRNGSFSVFPDRKTA